MRRRPIFGGIFFPKVVVATCFFPDVHMKKTCGDGNFPKVYMNFSCGDDNFPKVYMNFSCGDDNFSKVYMNFSCGDDKIFEKNIWTSTTFGKKFPQKWVFAT